MHHIEVDIYLNLIKSCGVIQSIVGMEGQELVFHERFQGFNFIFKFSI